MANTSNASSSDTVKAWLWVIEFCASVKEIGSETLHALIDAAPQFPKELGKQTMEMVALRCLEDLIEARSGLEEKASIDFSLSCEEVLHSILQEMSSSHLSKDGAGLSKWDIQPFIMHKRALMPECTLKQLKDSILEGTHPCIASLKESSGLFPRGDMDHLFAHIGSVAGEGNSTAPLENNVAVGDNSHDRNLLPCKRDIIELANELGDHHENNECNDLNSDAKKLKKDGLVSEQPTGHILASKCGKDLVEGDSGRMAEDDEEDDFCVETEPQLEQLEESGSLDNGHGDGVVIAGIGQSPEAGDESGHNQCETEINPNIVIEPISGCPPQQHILVDKTDKVEDRMLDVACSARIEPDTFIDEAKMSSDPINHLKFSKVASFDEFCEKVNLEEPDGEGDEDHLSEDETSSDDKEFNHGRVDSSDDEEDNHERVDVSLKKNQFLSSQCPQGDDSVSMSYWTEQNLCVKCNRGGQLLVCSLPGCPLAVHENCLSRPAQFNDKGDFYCPFCAYSLAISEYTEVKKRISLARKNFFRMFRCSSEHHGKKHTAELAGKKDHNLQHGRDERQRSACKVQKRTLKPQIVNSSEKLALAVYVDRETSGDQKENSLISNYSVRVRKRENQCTDLEIPILRRKKVPWTAKEEEMLKEGVEKFSSGHDRNIPWKKILEYGGSVFQHGRRTAVDLKDKWRNMRRASSKVK